MCMVCCAALNAFSTLFETDLFTTGYGALYVLKALKKGFLSCPGLYVLGWRDLPSWNRWF